jgi:hypothetical protein
MLHEGLTPGLWPAGEPKLSMLEFRFATALVSTCMYRLRSCTPPPPPPKWATKTPITLLERKMNLTSTDTTLHSENGNRFAINSDTQKHATNVVTRADPRVLVRQTHAASASVTTSYLVARRSTILTEVYRDFPRFRHENVGDNTTN